MYLKNPTDKPIKISIKGTYLSIEPFGKSVKLSKEQADHWLSIHGFLELIDGSERFINGAEELVVNEKKEVKEVEEVKVEAPKEAVVKKVVKKAKK